MIDFTSSKFADFYDDAPLWSVRFGTLLLDNIELGRNLRVMDLGCGTGFPLFELANALGNTCRLTGVDIWEAALSHAEAKCRFYGLEHVDFVNANGAALPFTDESFDLIVSNLGLNNFDKPNETISECARVLKSTGRLALTTNLCGHMRELYEEYRLALEEIGLNDRVEHLEMSENRRATPESIASLFENAGLPITRQLKSSFTWRFLDGTAFLRHAFIRVGFLDGFRQVVNPKDEDRALEALERRLNARAAREGQLSMTIPMLYVEARKP